MQLIALMNGRVQEQALRRCQAHSSGVWPTPPCAHNKACTIPPVDSAGGEMKSKRRLAEERRGHLIITILYCSIGLSA
jgi:hypothetical protein